ncbi:MAG: sodium:calcium antiporter [Clostridiales bacterium]|nr:sodium:calcium antiporter [Clostridiales bacterium]MCF8022273.1 sodium:calcium antiporter [Clostridiales bacterium]
MINFISYLLISLGIILIGAAFFTNSVEWFGKKLNLTRGAVGSILAAVGTALPETLIPVTAILLGTTEAAHEIGVGAILGAPFMLSTLAMALVGISAIVFKSRRGNICLKPDLSVLQRDLSFFITAYTIAVGAAFVPQRFKIVLVFLLLCAYVLFVYKTLTAGENCEEDVPAPLYLCRKKETPVLSMVVMQLMLSFTAIIVGARFFVYSVENLSYMFGFPAFIMSLLIAPVATELPEKFNSVIWIYQKKDMEALGNISGAMVFQSSIIPAIGIILTPWVLIPAAIISAVFALVAATAIYFFIRKYNYIDARFLAIMGGLLYSFFIAAVFQGIIR